MKRTIALGACLAVLAAACGSSDGDSGDTAPTEATEAQPANTDPVATEPAVTTPAEDPEPEPTDPPEPEPEPETTTTTEPPPALNVVGLVPLPGAQLNFSAEPIAEPTLVWSMYSGSGGVILENLGGPIPPGCYGNTFFDPVTFEVLQIGDLLAEAYATVGEGSCDNMQDVADGAIDGDAVTVNAEHVIQIDYDALPDEPFTASNQVCNPGCSEGIFLSTDRDAELPINRLSDATHAVGVTGVFEIEQLDRTLMWLDLPVPAPGPGCEGSSLCLNDRFQVDVLDPSGNPASVLTSGENGGRFYFFGAHDVNILVSVLNACELNENFWVFAAATADVAYDLTVTDTTTGESRAYSNPLGQPAAAITDTEAFATCP